MTLLDGGGTPNPYTFIVGAEVAQLITCRFCIWKIQSLIPDPCRLLLGHPCICKYNIVYYEYQYLITSKLNGGLKVTYSRWSRPEVYSL